ncbi:MAG: hypothetical protein AAF703_02130 [Cyanobacteria bacterium P01_D01_bin.105]
MMKNAMKSVLTAALVVMVPVVNLGMTASEANAQRRPSGTLVQRPAQNEPVRRPRPTEPVEVIIVEPVTLEPADNNSGGGLPADDPWITHCLTEHDAGEDIDDCLKDGGL